jgi:hypothetical protein
MSFLLENKNAVFLPICVFCRELKALSKNHNLMKKLEKKWWVSWGVSRKQVSKKK